MKHQNTSPISPNIKGINTSEIKIVKNLLKLETNLRLLRLCLNEQQNKLKKEAEKCLPNLKLSLDEPKNLKITSPNRPLRGQTLSVDSELVSSSVISSSSTNADLSEDEQINYYDEDNLNQDDLNQRSQSTGSDQTLVLMPNNSVITESVKFQKIKFDRKLDEEVSDEDEVHSNSVLVKEYDQVDEEEYGTPENEKEIDADSKIKNLISIKIKPNEDDNDSESSDYRIPTPPKSEPPSLPINSQYSIYSNTYNDLSDDEVKEYHVFNKEIFDDDNDGPGNSNA
ncbi:unnamed protein product [Brachionus calyciflorus]|uniref:Uncharacterized protein n=1 Tax=Brachionus calyciflorus TaxID=104777 RepID=A0A813UDN7_9BILA|nr:unnamed protein product [Brachionus calyciflorus]